MTETIERAPSGRPSGAVPVFCALLIVASTFAVFSDTLRSGFTGWDDELYVYQNVRIRSLAPPDIAWFFTHSFFSSYTPLAFVTHALDYWFWGNDPRGHHLTSILLHCANAVWVFVLGRLLLSLMQKKTGPEREWSRTLAAAIAALLFALHPLRVESIASVADRKDLLCAFFLLPSIIAYIRYARSRGSSTGKAWYAVAFASYVLALLSKSVAVALPLLFLLLDIVLLEPASWRGMMKRLLVEKMPFFALSIAIGIVAGLTAPLAEQSDLLSGLSAFEQRMLPWYNLAFYPFKTLWPSNLGILYTYDPLMFRLLAATGVVVTLVLLFLVFRRWLVIPAVWGAYALLLIPTSGLFLSAIQPTADRYSYLPTIFLFILGGGILTRVLTDQKHARSAIAFRGAMIALPLILLATSALLTVRQIRHWKDTETLWRHMEDIVPESPYPWYNVGLARQNRGDLDGAIEEYAQALRRKPDYPEVFVNLGNIHASKGDTSRAIASYEHAIEIRPSFILAYNDLAGVLLADNRIDESIAAYRKSLLIDPQSPDAMYGLGLSYRAKGDTAQALQILGRLTRVDPMHARAFFEIGLMMLERGDITGAVENLKRAAQLDLSEAQRILLERNVEW